MGSIDIQKAATAAAAAASEGGGDSVVVDGPQILVSVTVNGVRITIAKRNLEHFDGQDPYFFDSDYTIAGSTGFLLWEANWLLLRLLRSCATFASPIPTAAPALAPEGPAASASPSASSRLHLGQLLASRRVLDLGSGTGLAGLCAAACGAHVLLTDLASVCAGALRQNVERNAHRSAAAPPPAQGAETVVPVPVAVAAAAPAGGEHGLARLAAVGADVGPASGAAAAATREAGPDVAGVSGREWAGAVPVGRGSAAVMALDWTEPLEPQARAAGNDPRDADYILAVDTIWLLDIFHCFLDVVMAVLRGGLQAGSPDTASAQGSATGTDAGAHTNSTSGAGAGEGKHQGCGHAGTSAHQRACFLAFVERAGAESKLFVHKERVVEELLARGCAVETLIAEDVDVDGVARPGRVLRVTLAGTA